MGKLQYYTNKAIEFATPYVKSAGEHVDAAAKSVCKTYQKKRRKLNRALKWNRYKNILEGCVAVALLLASVIAIVMMITDRLHLGGKKYIQL